MARVFVDTNVLFPFSVMDLLLVLTEDAVRESDLGRRSLGRVEKVIVGDHRRRNAESAASVTARHACGNVLWYSVFHPSVPPRDRVIGQGAPACVMERSTSCTGW